MKVLLGSLFAFDLTSGQCGLEQICIVEKVQH